MNDDTGNDEVFDRNDRALAVMAHDIKTPLTSIVSLLNVIKKGYVTDYDKVKDLVTRAGRQAETLIAMIDDILDYTLLADKSKVQREAVHLAEVFHDSLSAMKDYARQRNIAISSSPDIGSEAYIYGSYTFLLRAFNNILMNAIKYNRENGTIDITCLENTDKNTLVINFNDSGIGIPQEDLDKVFKIFERGKQARRNLDGSLGLGMALVKQIIQYHLGEILVTSAVDIGTTVIVTLPLFKPIKKQGGTDES